MRSSKPSLFNALTAAGAPSENYPFCTVEPNVGTVEVPDRRLDRIHQLAQSKTRVPTVIQFVDIAGLVEGASEGEGLGNKFLGNIREVDAIVHVLRCFDDGDITHVLGGVDPVRDREIVETELALADLDTVQRRLEKVGKKAKSGDKEAIREREGQRGENRRMAAQGAQDVAQSRTRLRAALPRGGGSEERGADQQPRAELQRQQG